MRADPSRDVSFVTALLLFGWHLTQTYAYRDEARAQVDDAWERPLIARAGGAPGRRPPGPRLRRWLRRALPRARRRRLR